MGPYADRSRRAVRVLQLRTRGASAGCEMRSGASRATSPQHSVALLDNPPHLTPGTRVTPSFVDCTVGPRKASSQFYGSPLSPLRKIRQFEQNIAHCKVRVLGGADVVHAGEFPIGTDCCQVRRATHPVAFRDQERGVDHALRRRPFRTPTRNGQRHRYARSWALAGGLENDAKAPPGRAPYVVFGVRSDSRAARRRHPSSTLTERAPS